MALLPIRLPQLLALAVAWPGLAKHEQDVRGQAIRQATCICKRVEYALAETAVHHVSAERQAYPPDIRRMPVPAANLHSASNLEHYPVEGVKQHPFFLYQTLPGRVVLGKKINEVWHAGKGCSPWGELGVLLQERIVAEPGYPCEVTTRECSGANTLQLHLVVVGRLLDSSSEKAEGVDKASTYLEKSSGTQANPFVDKHTSTESYRAQL